jgi:hypothetical protein
MVEFTDPPVKRARRLKAWHLLDCREEQIIRFIEGRVIQNGYRPTAIAITFAALWLNVGRTTWVRTVRRLERDDVIRREVRRGRARGGGKNAGSVYWVNWNRLAELRSRSFKTAHFRLQTDHNGHRHEFENGSLAAKTGPQNRDGNRTIVGRNLPKGREAAGDTAPGRAAVPADAGPTYESASPLPLSGSPPPAEVSEQVAALFSRGGSPNGCG